MKNYFTLFYIFFFSSLFSQTEFKFERITTDEGLPANDVEKIFQDSKGFIWFGMKGAICRYDGFVFEDFPVETKTGDKKIQTWISDITEDKNGTVWLGEIGEYGPLYFDSDKEKFINAFEKLRLPEKMKKVNVYSILADSNENIWVNADKYGIIKYNLKTDSAQHFTNNPDDPLSIPVGSCSVMKEDKSTGDVYMVFTTFLFKYSHSDNTIKKIAQFDGAKNIDIHFDNQYNLWIVADEVGIFKYNKVRKRPEQQFFDSIIPDSILINSGVIATDKNNNLWVTTDYGVLIYDNLRKVYSLTVHDESDLESLTSNLVRCFFNDRSGNMWVGTSEGISKLKQQHFNSFRFSNQKNSISQNKVQYIVEGKRGKIYFSMPQGVDVYDRASNYFSPLFKLKQRTGLPSKSVVVLEEQKKRGIYLGTFGDGLYFYDYNTQSIIKDKTSIDIMNSMKEKMIMALKMDNNENLWIGTWGEGVNMLDTRTGIVKKFPYETENKNTLPSGYIRVISIDSKNQIWAGTINGIGLMSNNGDSTFRKIMDNKMIDNEIKELLIFDLLEESGHKYMWIGTSVGLIQYDIEKEKAIRLYTENDGLPGNKIESLLEDNSKNLWIGTSNGLVMFSPDYEQPEFKPEIRIYKKSDGLQGKEFLPASRCRLKDGTMLFGGYRGFTMFQPDSINDNMVEPLLAFTNIEISNTPVEIGEKVNDQVILDKSITNTKHLILNHKNNNFSIEFVALHFNQPLRNKYAYKLVGFDDSWHTCGAYDRKAGYMNLPSGEYEFLVKAANCDEIWNDKSISLLITIFPPWWKTWWFRVLITMFLISSVLSIYLYRINALKRQKAILERKVFERTQELREANSQLEEKQEEILQQNEEIITVNNQLKTKNEEIESQKEEIIASRDQLEKAFNNITLLSEFGQKLTATFDFDAINKMIYNYVSSLMDTSAFGIGIYNEKRKIIDFPYFMENGEPVPYFFKPLSSEKSLTVRCFKNSEEIFINDLSIEYKKYLGELPEVQTSKLPSSVIHLPLIVENRPIGTITVNSFKKDAFNDSDVANLRTLASYISIALDNSKAYRIIRSKNEQINGSIRYGQTIQQAMLPPKEQIDKYFENFILFRPKDIVSGDFYWFASIQNLEGLGSDKLKNLQGFKNGLDSDNSKNPQGFNNDYYFLAVIDCTGHGVPGAFMSMIGSRLLNDIVIERKIISPAKILEQLNIMIRKALRQDTTDNHDGMDVCLCRFQKSGPNWELTYAGAKRSLLFLNSESNMIEEIQGTRRSIGGVAARKSIIDFTEVTRIIKEKDVFYLSTDGLVDQCNPQKRKFSQKKLVSVLGEIQHLPLSEQHKYLEKELDSFQAGFEQRDDISLVGLKIKNGL